MSYDYIIYCLLISRFCNMSMHSIIVHLTQWQTSYLLKYLNEKKLPIAHHGV